MRRDISCYTELTITGQNHRAQAVRARTPEPHFVDAE
jgi:hypothetical protein